ncbi:MAG TPA: helix-turn-helix domain-containing protein, partial [Acidimicrobiales bacterium]|nr:helix-turn-helix domain-containing protein [Acidimicrobiales bacterium]
MNDCLPVRALGRPRSELADRAILAAARTLLARDGVDGMNVETVAALAGVGKATVYRRYPCRAELVVAAAGCLA